jgi:hypothetical protein
MDEDLDYFDLSLVLFPFKAGKKVERTALAVTGKTALLSVVLIQQTSLGRNLSHVQS